MDDQDQYSISAVVAMSYYGEVGHATTPLLRENGHLQISLFRPLGPSNELNEVVLKNNAMTDEYQGQSAIEEREIGWLSTSPRAFGWPGPVGFEIESYKKRSLMHALEKPHDPSEQNVK